MNKINRALYLDGKGDARTADENFELAALMAEGNSHFEGMLERIKQADFATLVKQGDRVPELMNRVAPIFEEFHIFDQCQTVALLLGMFCAAVEGEPVSFELEPGGCLITFEERLRIFNEVSRVTFKEAYAARMASDAPESISGQRKM